MAKSKRARRARRQKQAVDTAAEAQETTQPAAAAAPTGPEVQNDVNFAKEYFYVYKELRNILIVTIVMFAVMAGLAYFI